MFRVPAPYDDRAYTDTPKGLCRNHEEKIEWGSAGGVCLSLDACALSAYSLSLFFGNCFILRDLRALRGKTMNKPG